MVADFVRHLPGTTPQLSSNEETATRERMLVRKLNLILVQVLKQEWPHNWPGFIPEIVASSKVCLTQC